MRKHKVDWGPGYRFFKCETCNKEWAEKSRDCMSPSSSACMTCHNPETPTGFEKHFEWETDRFGNLIEDIYEH
jgi:hypothetical protein